MSTIDPTEENRTDENEVEGHCARFSIGTDDGTDNEVAGHSLRIGISTDDEKPEDDEVEGHIFRV